MRRLCDSILDQINPEFIQPSYDRSALATGMVHLGVGAFHRAHQALYQHRLMNLGGGYEWAITGVSLRSATASRQLNPQDGLYCVTERSSGRVSRRDLVGSIRQVLNAIEHQEQIFEVLVAETTRVISLTVTEKGYYYAFSSRSLDLHHPDVQDDLSGFPAQQKTLPGILVAMLAARRKSHGHGVSLLSCDNLPANGEILRQVVLEYAQHVDGDLAEWIEKSTSFPCSMVDRIVPATATEDLHQLAEALQAEDQAGIFTETFSQWVVEDDFVRGRPAWETVGVLMVPDVHPYEQAKLRLLNGSHSLMAYIGQLCGYTYVHEAINDSVIAALVTRFMKEVEPGLSVPDDFDLDGYEAELRERFSNSSLCHELAQIAQDGSLKIPQRWLASVSLSDCKKVQCHALALAGWIRYLKPDANNGREFDLKDPNGEAFRQSIIDNASPVFAVLDQLGFGELAEKRPDFIEQTTQFLEQFQHEKITEILARELSLA